MNVTVPNGVRRLLSAGRRWIRTLGSPHARISSVVAFIRATRGPRACKFPVRRRFSSICSSRRATPWSQGESGLGSLRCHLSPLRRRPILELCQCNMRPCARRAVAGPAGDRVYRCPSFSLEIEHFRDSAPGMSLRLIQRVGARPLRRQVRARPEKSRGGNGYSTAPAVDRH